MGYFNLKRRVDFSSGLIYSGVRYLEFAFLGGALIYLGSVTDPESMALLLPIFLFTQFGAYASLGFISLYPKIHIESPSDLDRARNAVFQIIWSVATSIIYILIFAWVFNVDRSLVVIAGSLTLFLNIRGVLQVIFRSFGYLNHLTIGNVLYSSTFVVSLAYDLQVQTAYEPSDYLESWIYANLVFVIFGFFCVRKVIGGENLGLVAIDFRGCTEIIRKQFINSIKMLILGIAALVTLSFDRLVINFLGFSDLLIGHYVMADNLAVVFHRAFSVVSFLLVPHVLSIGMGEQKSSGTLGAYAGIVTMGCGVFFMAVHWAVGYADFGYYDAMPYFGPIMLIKYFSLCQFAPTYLLVAKEQYSSVFLLYMVSVVVISVLGYSLSSFGVTVSLINICYLAAMLNFIVLTLLLRKAMISISSRYTAQ